MSDLSLQQVSLASTTIAGDAPFVLNVRFAVDGAIAFDVDVSLDIEDASGRQLAHAQLAAAGWDVSWLPRGDYEAHALAAHAGLPAGRYVAQVALWHRRAGVLTKAGAASIAFDIAAPTRTDGFAPAWQLRSGAGAPAIESLSWKRGAADWFYKHFDHAARTTATYLLGDSPLLRGRILDVGCGDGITDLGIALRKRPLEFVGIDPFPDFERLPKILSERGLSPDIIPKNLRFIAADANDIPFPDDHFDVLVSWGSVEHMAGGYAKALQEMRRVLKPDGLLMIAPGLYYSDVGNHMGEFRFAQREPYVHLKRPPEWIREQILLGDIEPLDRCGWEPTMEQHWKFISELNPITVPGFERELRDLGFEPWRVALRTHDRVDYTPELQRYSFVDLAVGELLLSAYNRKHRL